VQLADHGPGFEDVFQHRLDDHGVHGLGRQGDAVGVGDDLGQWARVDVEGQHVDVGRAVKLFESEAQVAPPDHQYQRRSPDGMIGNRPVIVEEQGQQMPDFVSGDGVGRFQPDHRPAAQPSEPPVVPSERRRAAGGPELRSRDDARFEVDENGLTVDVLEGMRVQGTGVIATAQLPLDVYERASAPRADQQVAAPRQ
jgi:hypothetical protein